MESNDSFIVNENNNNVEVNSSKDGFGLGCDSYSDEISKCSSVERRVSGLSQFAKTYGSSNERRSSLRRNVSKGNLMSSDHTESKVLVIYTGGTIGMMRNENNGESCFDGSSLRLFFSYFNFCFVALLIELLFVLQTVCLHR